MSDSIIERIRKIKTLADQATNEGERTNATLLLNKLLEAHQLTIEDIVKPERKWVGFDYYNAWQKKVFIHCYCKVMNVNEMPHLKRGRMILIQATKLEYAEMNIMYAHYWRLWNQELKRLWTVFINKHDLFAEDTPTAPSKLTDEETMRLAQMYQAMESSIDPRHRLLGDGE